MKIYKSILKVAIILSILLLVGCDDFFDDELESDATIVEVNKKVSATSDESFSFETVDIDGNKVSSDDFSDAKVIMINFWEPWCGPCVGEMSDLEMIYQNYKDEGFVILGVFTSEGMDKDVINVIEQTGVTYPIIRATKSMEHYMTQFVPTTVFFDSEWNMLIDEQIPGARSYEEWESLVELMLED